LRAVVLFISTKRIESMANTWIDKASPAVAG
jgi:hypothetical protein